MVTAEPVLMKKLIPLTLLALTATAGAQSLSGVQLGLTGGYASGLSGEICRRFRIGYAPPGWKGLASAFPSYDDPLLVESGLVIVQGEGEDAEETVAQRPTTAIAARMTT